MEHCKRGGGSFSSPSSATSTFSGTAGTAYRLRWTISNPPCNASSDDVYITFNTLPLTPSVSASGPLTFTKGGSITLTSTAASGYLWSTGETTRSITVTGSGSYSVQAVNAVGCKSAPCAAVDVTVYYMELTPESLTFPEEGGTKTFIISTNTPTQVINFNGCVASATRSGNVVSVTCAPNSGYATGGAVTVVCEGLAGSGVSVSQQGCTPPPAPTITASGSTVLAGGALSP